MSSAPTLLLLCDATFPTSKLTRRYLRHTASNVDFGSLMFVALRERIIMQLSMRVINKLETKPELLELMRRSNVGAPMFLRASNSFGYLTVEGYRGHVFPIIFSEVGSWMATVRGLPCTLAPATSNRHFYTCCAVCCTGSSMSMTSDMIRGFGRRLHQCLQEQLAPQ